MFSFDFLVPLNRNPENMADKKKRIWSDSMFREYSKYQKITPHQVGLMMHYPCYPSALSNLQVHHIDELKLQDMRLL